MIEANTKPIGKLAEHESVRIKMAQDGNHTEFRPPPPSVEHCLELAKLTQQDFGSRRGLEWKLSFGFWGSIFAFVYALIQQEGLHKKVAEFLWDVDIVIPLAIVLPLVIALIIVYADRYVLRLIQLSHYRDRKLYWYFREAVEKRDEVRPFDIGKMPSASDLPKERHRTGWLRFHLFITILVLCMAWALVLAGVHR